MARRLAVLSTGRQDYGILRSTILGMDRDPRFELHLWVGGMHLGQRFGATADMIREDGIETFRILEFLADPPEPARDGARAMSEVIDGIDAVRPDALILLGDRSETMACAVAAAVLAVPTVHFHGGEETEGAIDNALRHAITKLSQLHFTTHQLHANRVLQMGEDPSTVHVVGPPGVDNLFRSDLPDRAELLSSLDIHDPSPGPLVAVTIHPTTLSKDGILAETKAVADALAGVECCAVVTMPNADAGGILIQEFWESWADGRPWAKVTQSLGERRYWGLMRTADVMVSNSSSGLIEAPAAALPVVNVGDRQKGRLRHPMTLDVGPSAEAICAALQEATAPGFRRALRESVPLYPKGPAGPKILEVLAAWDPPRPPRKVFVDAPAGAFS